MMKILAIETSCDETALALLEAEGGLRAPKIRVKKNLVSSQIAVHAPFGGVVPNLAKREHLKNLPVLFKELLPRPARYTPDIIAVTVGPGLEPALWTGINFAKELHTTHFPKAKLVGTNHLEGHLASILLTSGVRRRPLHELFPSIALLVSGGHTIILSMDSLVKWSMLGETRDDAVGEAFDKVARILNLPYPGGPEVARLATKGNPAAIPFPRPMLHDTSYDFSFSGLKTSVLYHRRDHPRASPADIAASFEEAAIDALAGKVARALREYPTHSLLLSGGVAANRALRARLAMLAKKHRILFFAPPFAYNTDNAAMIGVAGYLTSLRGKRYPLRANGTLSL
ncbi:MAG: tRNA (adenosine(37)-N6)-threonylcarbamoyltransferase complex transferase subunit TsaD [Candidatus Jorgensenbacteria bacterium]|nr:tRNA (adenosine(37)-N6)-threonylcarbamoyltransferase complex transferase subunit TsaD [Candidatus Jorgensenbacteria bacterium]